MSETENKPVEDDGRNSRRVVQGVVSGDKAAKTIAVTIERRFKHIKYQKYIRRHEKIYAHDEQNEAHIGDTVELMECRPLSKLKRWRLVRVVERSVMPSGGAL
jgi:small subunit ribosomal protein S17